MDPVTVSAATGSATVWAEYAGPLGLVIFALFVLVVWLVRVQRDERKEWREVCDTIARRGQDLQGETNQVLRDLAVAVGRMEPRR